MSKKADAYPVKTPGDLVLQEVWRAKDTLSSEYDYDLERLFAQTRAREKRSGHPLVDPPKRRRKT